MTSRRLGFVCLWTATCGVLVPAMAVTGPVVELTTLGVLTAAGLLLLGESREEER